ncbi:MAG: 50S ribosomal protein L24 [Oligoflexia bacterium]|nr:50S ribosomal protein L24 [Oligoflexia bacterium]
MKEQEVDGYPAYKKNDVVQVISGKYKGKSGKILRMIKDKGRIVVEKINLVKRHTKPSQANPQGGIIEKEAPLHVSKVLPVSSKTGKPMRISKWLKENSRVTTKGKSKERGAK